MEQTGAEVYDLMIVVDATYSMFNYLEALQTSIPKIVQISQLTDCFERIGLLAYRDYSEEHRAKDGLLEWSGWLHTDARSTGLGIDSKTLMEVARKLEPIGGGDFPEATKTGLARAHQLMREDATTVVLLYTDATPHIAVDGSGKERNSNQNMEKDNLTGRKPSKLYGVGHADFADWVSLANALRNGQKKCQVFSFLDEQLASWKCLAGYYSYLSAITHGACFSLTNSDPTIIASITVEALLSWMGVEKSGASSSNLPAKLARYINGNTIRKLKNESDEAANDYFWASGSRDDAETRVNQNIAEVRVTSDVLKAHMPKKKNQVQNFAERYKHDVEGEYRVLVRAQLAKLIENDVTAFSLNPVFGSLWRAVCNDKEWIMRDALLNAFSAAVERIGDAGEKVRMKAWLEESYDYAADITEIVKAVPEAERFPCLFLDPTLRHGTRDEDGRPMTEFRRDELLEIGRSCDYRVLRRLGKVLTELTYAERDEDLPTHIRAANIPLIPLCLGNKAHKFQLFRILLHVIVPGTMLGHRPSAVLAALAIKMGIRPLAEPAAHVMSYWRGKWNNIEIPETWNTSCLSLLIDADDAHKRAQKPALLETTERGIFEKLVAYKLAESNLQTALMAKVGWTPDKTSMAIGPTTICRSCNYPRSITMMAEKSGGLCGLCVATDYPAPAVRDRYTHERVSKEDTSMTPAIWVECNDRDCRAQYVVYNVAELNVRPKCYYCRQKQTAPWIECATCLNRTIWPTEYRDHEMRTGRSGSFKCVSCTHDRMSIVEVETSAQILAKENGNKWLLDNKENVLQEPFGKRSLFHVASTVGPEVFMKNITVLPNLRGKLSLQFKGKLVRNPDDIRTQLQSWIDRRRAEAIPCSLCFSDFHRSKLHAACGRRGCDQAICAGCLKSWYGTNSAGHIINPATLTCPFCRRPPAWKTLAAYGMGVRAVGNLVNAVAERGTWIYAWCLNCSCAARYMERVCAQGAPPELDNFVCEHCVDSEAERLRLEEEAARLALAEARRADWENVRGAEIRLREAAALRAALDRPVKKCPKCGVLTQLIDGCNHLTCPCKAHWCWACGKEFTARGIYGHMREAHGGFYDGGEDDQNEGDDEDD